MVDQEKIRQVFCLLYVKSENAKQGFMYEVGETGKYGKRSERRTEERKRGGRTNRTEAVQVGLKAFSEIPKQLIKF